MTTAKPNDPHLAFIKERATKIILETVDNDVEFAMAMRDWFYGTLEKGFFSTDDFVTFYSPYLKTVNAIMFRQTVELLVLLVTYYKVKSFGL